MFYDRYYQLGATLLVYFICHHQSSGAEAFSVLYDIGTFKYCTTSCAVLVPFCAICGPFLFYEQCHQHGAALLVSFILAEALSVMDDIGAAATPLADH